MDKDIQEMFRQKNREMLIHNLELDIERNVGILQDALQNQFSLQFDTAIKNIYSIYDEQMDVQEITKILTSLKEKVYSLLFHQIHSKKDILVEQVRKLNFQKEEMEEYYQLVFQTTEEVYQVFKSDEMDQLKKETIEKFQTISEKLFQDAQLDIVEYRVRDYIIDRLFGKLRDKVKEELFIRDNNLSNKGKESYEKFQELETKTTNL